MLYSLNRYLSLILTKRKSRYLALLLFIIIGGVCSFQPGSKISQTLASSSWAQSDWSGGSGQTNWNNVGQYFEATNLTALSPNQLTISVPELFSNNGFEDNLTGWTGTQPYLLQDNYNNNLASGNLHNTSAVPGPGTRTVVDTNSKISISNETLNFATGGAVNNGVWYNSQQRVSGKILSGTITPADTNGIPTIGWASAPTGAIRDALKFNTTTGLQITPNGSSPVTVGNYSPNTSYQIASVMRSTGNYWFIKGGNYNNWSFLWYTSVGNGAAYPSVQTQNTTSTFAADMLHVPTISWLPTPLAYDTFNQTNGSLGSSDATGPDNQLTTSLPWVGSTWTISSNAAINTPGTGSELTTNVDFESGNPPTGWIKFGSANLAQVADQRTGGVGNYSISLTNTSTGYPYFRSTVLPSTPIGSWISSGVWLKNVTGAVGARLYDTSGNTALSSAPTDYIADTWIYYPVTARSITTTSFLGILSLSNQNGKEIRADDYSFKLLDTPQLFSSVSSAKADIIAEANVTWTQGTQAGLVINLDSTDNPQNFVIVYLTQPQSSTLINVDKVINGTYTNILTGTVTYAAGATIRLIKTGSSYSVFYNGIQVGTTQTISDNTIINNTLHGLFSTHTSNTFDEFLVWARGSNGEYANLPVDDLVISYDTEHLRVSSTHSAKLIAGGNAGSFYQNVNVGNTDSYKLVAYAYTNGGTISASDLQLEANGALIPTTYLGDAQNPGWYRLSGIVTGSASAIAYGVRVMSGQTVWLDDVSLQPQSVIGVLTSSIYDTGSRSSWGSVTYNATTPPDSSVTIKVMTSNSPTFSTSFSSCQAVQSGQNVSAGGCASGQRYLQYQITLTSSNHDNLPNFSAITINYSAQSNTYYVSSSLGNDSNDGLTIDSPWQTIAKVNSSSFLPSDQILFKRGDTWREKLIISWSGTSNNPITFSAYGSGSLPKLLISAAWNQSQAWTDLGNNLWQTNYTGTTGSEQITNPSFATNTNGWFLYANAGAGAEATLSRTTTNGEYNTADGALKISVTSRGTSSTDLQLQAPTSRFAIQNNEWYQLTFYAMASTEFSFDHAQMFKGVNPYNSYNSASTPSIKIGTNWQQYRLFFLANTSATDAIFAFYFGNTIPNGTTLYLDDISLKPFSSSTFLPTTDIGNINFNVGSAYGHKKIGSLEDLQQQGDFYYDPRYSTVVLYSTSNPADYYSSIELGIKYSAITLGSSSFITIKNLHIANSGLFGISGSSGASNIEIANNEITNIGGSIQSGSVRLGNAIQFWNNVHDVNVHRNKIWEIYDSAITTQGDSGSQFNIYFRNNVIWDAEMGIEEFLTGDGEMSHIYVDNNTIVNLGSQSSHVDRPDPRARGIYFGDTTVPNIHDIYVRNNIISGSTDKLLEFDRPFTTASNLFIKNNLLWASTATNPAVQWAWQWQTWGPGVDYDLNHLIGNQVGYWQYDTTQAVGNKVANPQFINSANNDYSLKFSSAARDAGISISDMSRDFSDLEYHSLADIGAHDYQLPIIRAVNSAVMQTTGGSVSILNNHGYGLNLTIPVSFADSDATFYAYQLNNGNIQSPLNNPQDSQLVGDHIYDLSALTNERSLISTFPTHPISLSLSYSSTDITNIDESSLLIYRYDPGDSGWTALTGCSHDKGIKNIRCSTDTFSTFALFGKPLSSTSQASNNSSTPTCTTESPGDKAPWLQSGIAQTAHKVILHFTSAQDPYDHYTIAYGLKPGEYKYGAINVGDHETRSLTINSLNPNTTYYFRIMGVNGCATGPWSNELSVRTKKILTTRNLQLNPGIFEIESSPQSSPSCQTYRVQPGDTLWSLAQSLLGNASLYQNIISQNIQQYPSITSSLQIGWELQLSCQQPPTLLSEGYNLKLRVVDSREIPVAGATITIHSEVQTATSDADGYVVFHGLEEGKHTLTIEFSGYTGEETIALSGQEKDLKIELKLKPQTYLISPLAWLIILTLLLIIIVVTIKYRFPSRTLVRK